MSPLYSIFITLFSRSRLPTSPIPSIFIPLPSLFSSVCSHQFVTDAPLHHKIVEQIKWDQIVEIDLQKLIQFHFNQFAPLLIITTRKVPSLPPLVVSFASLFLRSDCAAAHHHHSQGSLTPTLGCSLRKSWLDLKFGESKVGQEGSSRKKSQTLTSVLTARSKAACGLTDKPKPKEQIMDIDAADIDNELAIVEYVKDIYKFYKQVENESRVHDYMDSQPEINEKMRAILVDWLIEVHNKFELIPETLYLTINIVDRYLASKPVMRRELQ
ncbi:hypothetical protein ACSBR2_041048 [Camellia fascicularis]